VAFVSRHRREGNGLIADTLLFLAIMGTAVLVGTGAVLLLLHSTP
jgi:hypothetical protein